MSAQRRSQRKRGLGRGLGALLGDSDAVSPSPDAETRAGSETRAASQDGPVEHTVSIDALVANDQQPRTLWDDSRLDELAESIKTQGILQPIVAVRDGGGAGRHRIVAGERRWRAARRAGLKDVPVVYREVADDQEYLELALVENLQRADLNPIEEAEAFEALRDRFGLSQGDIAARVGKSRPSVTNALRLLRLPDQIVEWLRSGDITAGQARPLIGLADPVRQLDLAKAAAEESLSAREIEARVAALSSEAEATPRRERTQGQSEDVHTRAAVERLTRSLQTKVDIKRKRRGGTIRIHFHSEDELMRLYELLTDREDIDVQE